MANLIPILQQELTELEESLRADPRYRKIETIKKLLADYGHEPASQKTLPFESNRTANLPPATPRTRPSSVSTHSSKKATVMNEINAFLSERGRSVHRTEILERLESKGLMGGETNPLQSLAIYLSSSNKFEGDGKGYWKIKRTEAPTLREGAS